jgi:hypothetical protein
MFLHEVEEQRPCLIMLSFVKILLKLNVFNLILLLLLEVTGLLSLLKRIH